MAKVTLAQLQAEADGKYGDYVVELPSGNDLVLRSVLRLSDAKQDKVRELQNKMDSAGKDSAEEGSTKVLKTAVHELIRTVAATRKPADELIKLHGDDLGFLLVLVGNYTKDSQLGEASTSES